MQPKTLKYWETLRQIRQPFLGEQPVVRDYWKNSTLLDAYDESFATRIGWKWAAVLDELQQLDWAPPTATTLLDWGCGTGIAARQCHSHWSNQLSTVVLHDRSTSAVNYATTKLRDQSPNVTVGSLADWRRTVESTMMIASHVVTELSAQGLQQFRADAGRCTHLLCVEPGTKAAATKLALLRDDLIADGWQAVAPCTHQNTCPAVKSDKHWCHSFAAPPKEVHQSAYWRAFSTHLEIDIRTLPYSYVLLHRTSASENHATGVRVIGRPRLKKKHGTALLCSGAGLENKQLNSRKDSELFNALTNGDNWV